MKCNNDCPIFKMNQDERCAMLSEREKCCLSTMTAEQADRFITGIQSISDTKTNVNDKLLSFITISIESGSVSKIEIIMMMLNIMIELLKNDNSSIFSTYCRLMLKKVQSRFYLHTTS